MYKPRGSHLTADDLPYEIVLKKCCGKENQLNLKKSAEWSSLPPPRACLREHLKRVNYQEAIFKRFRISKPVIPLPTRDNEWILVNKAIEPKWSDRDIFPTHLADISDKALETKNEHGLVDGNIDKISTDDESDEEPESKTGNGSDQK